MKPSPPPAEPIGLLAAAVRQGVRQLVESRIGALDLSSRQFWVLVGIAERCCRSQAELAARLRIDEATACRVTRTLVARGLVEAVRDASDRRRVQLALTREGDRLAARLLPLAREVRAAVDAPLSPAEREATRAALVKIVAALQRLSASDPAAPPGGGAARPASRRRRASRAVPA
ncbi:MarR family winged helix-turn-helix transcriptional regulator [Anaeromyxobacter oryzae]|uniref:HTH marR-type domain-containing protein n=1 Tax=Anaeromyxobacter oryzae TaxID=2918170 RepID=A0ABM7WP66_9BACT|nr:MarR family transcriptional regulator [Anaeromyxobacter oryzae]BDG01256.1 hypothetical protein AMOR_02520 [Anaeromyxobacter oryzae]